MSQNLNPLDTFEQVFIELMNPNPTSSKTKAGPVYRVSFEMDKDSWQMFMDAADTPGMILNTVMQRERDIPEAPEPKKTKPEKGPYSDFARWIYEHGALRSPVLWDGLGSEDDHTKFIQNQPCCVCGEKDFVEDTGEAFCEEAHVRTSDSSGTAFKPKYISVPMCHHHHGIQHLQGYSALFYEYKKFHKTDSIRPDMVSDWMVDRLKKKAMEYIEEWMKQKLYQHFNVLTLTWVMPDCFQDMLNMFEGHGIKVPDKFLSPSYLEQD